jgi:hypothetical protein
VQENDGGAQRLKETRPRSKNWHMKGVGGGDDEVETDWRGGGGRGGVRRGGKKIGRTETGVEDGDEGRLDGGKDERWMSVGLAKPD